MKRKSDQVKGSWNFFIVPASILQKMDLTTHEKMTYIVIASHANRNGDNAFPSYRTIAFEGSMSRGQAMRCVTSLVEKKCIEKRPRFENGENTSNLYTLCDVVRSGDHQSPPLATDSNHPDDGPSLPLVTDGNHASPVGSPKHSPVTKPLDQHPLTTTDHGSVVALQNEISSLLGIQVPLNELTKWMQNYETHYIDRKVGMIAKGTYDVPLRALRSAIKKNWPDHPQVVKQGHEQNAKRETYQRAFPSVQPGKYDAFYEKYRKKQNNNSITKED